jgi:dihydroflavonol-4-reductase
MEGCSVVFHTASPFTMSIKDPQKELVDPALLGTRNVLDAVNRTPSVNRVVLTSSCVAIYGDVADQENVANGIFTEKDWNTTSTLAYMPYSYSKTVAEQAAWEVVKKQARWDMVVMNPGFVVGPGITPFATSESFKLIRQFGNGKMKSGLPDIGVAAVDVRDLAEAHLRAAFLPGANGRNIISGWNTSFPHLAKALLPRYEKYPIPKGKLPKWLVWLVAPLADKSMTRKFVARNVNYALVVDNSKGVRELGLHYRPLHTSIQEMFQQMVDHDLIPKP